MSKTEELLAVLDMSGDEQMKWIAETFVPKYGYRINLADLAFRLRDEVCKENYGEFHNGIFNIQTYLGEDNWATAFWGECFAKPIHWIIAALIVKISK